MAIGRYSVYLRKAIENGLPVFPEAFVLTDEELEERKRVDPNVKLESLQNVKNNNGYYWSGQYLNDPVDQDSVEFKQSWFSRMVITDELSVKLRNANVTLSIDPAFRLKQHNDFSGIVVTATTIDNNVYVLEAKQLKVNPERLLDEVFRLITVYHPQRVIVETAQAQLLLSGLIRDEMKKRNLFFFLEEISPGSDDNKAARIRGLIPHYSNFRIFHAEGLQDLEAQLTEFPRNSHDDIIDALAYQIPFWKAPGKEYVKPEGIREYSGEWWAQRKHRKSEPIRLKSLFKDIRR